MEAARILVKALSPSFARFCRMSGDPPDQVEDILQEIWLRVHQARHTYLKGAPASPWLFGIARHVRVDSYRKRRRVTSREHSTDVLPELAANAGRPVRDSRFEELLAALPESQREVLVLLKGAGMSLEEVARTMSTTVGAVKQKAHRAYERLRLALSEK